MKIDRRDTEYMKGIAILLMLGHHLFAFPDRILPPSFFIPIPGGLHLEETAGSFGKICVGIFLFLSGYGFAANGIKPLRYYIEKVWRFLHVYWFYFILFIPVGFLFFSHVTFFNSTTPRYEAKPLLCLLNFTALTFSYNEEWWFVQPYLLLVLSCPLALRLAKKPFVLLAAGTVLYNLAWILESRGLNTPYVSAVWFCRWQLPFVLGILAVTWKDRITASFARAEGISRILTAGACAAAIALLWHWLGQTGLILSTPLFIYLCLQVKKLTGKGWDLFVFLGGYSFPLWLPHSFFCYYYWQKAVYWPKYSPLVFLNLVVMTLVLCIAAEKVRTGLFTFPDILRRSASPSAEEE